MVNYLDVLVADEVYKERIRERRHYVYTPELPSMGQSFSGFARQIQSLLAAIANTIVTYQGQRAPIGRRLAAKRN